MKTEIYKKILNVKKAIKNTKIKKLGYNDYGDYSYFTPEQIDDLTFEESAKQGLFNKYQLKRTELGLVAVMEVIDLDTSEIAIFELVMDIPQIKATNISQQLGGAMTYSKRYLLMNIYDITDNTLDFDSQKPQTPKKQEDNKKWLNKYDKQGNMLEFYTKVVIGAKSKGSTISDLEKVFKISKQVKEELKKDLS